MASKGGVTIIVAGEDKTGEVFNAVNKHLQEVRERSKETGSALSEMGEVLKRGLETAGIAIGAREIIEGFKEMVTSTMEAGVQIGHLSQQTGISVQNLSTLKYAAQSTGVDFEVLTRGFKKLAVTTYEADTGNKEAAKGFAQLGISTAELRAKGDDMYGVMTLVANKFKEMPDGISKSDTAAKIFGARMGSEMIPVLDELGGEMDKVKAEAESLGLVWDESGIKKMEEMHKSVTEMKAAFAGLALEITSDLAPSLTHLAQDTAGFMKMVHLSPSQTLKGAYGAMLQQLLGSAGPGLDIQIDAAKSLTKLDEDTHTSTASDADIKKKRDIISPPNPHAGAELLQADRTAFAEAQRNHAMTIAEETEFWAKRLTAFKRGSSQYLEVLNELNRLTKEAATKSAEDQKRALAAFISESVSAAERQQSESARISEEVTRNWQSDLAAQTSSAEADAASAIARAASTAKIEEATIEHQRLSRTISETTAQQASATVHAKQYAAEIAALNAELVELQSIQSRGGDTSRQQTEVRNKITGLQGDASADAIVDAPIKRGNADLKAAGEDIAHDVFDPLFNFGEKWDKQWKQIKANLLRDLGQKAEAELFRGLFGDSGKKSERGVDAGPNGRTGLASEALGALEGLFHRKKPSVASNGGAATGAGTTPSPVASLLQIGKGEAGAGTGGIQVIINNNGAPVDVSDTAQGSSDGGESQWLQIGLKQLETNGSFIQGIKGLIPGL